MNGFGINPGPIDHTPRKDLIVPKETDKEIDLNIDHTKLGYPTQTVDNDNTLHHGNNEVSIMDPKHEDRTASFFAQPGILAGLYLLK